MGIIKHFLEGIYELKVSFQQSLSQMTILTINGSIQVFSVLYIWVMVNQGHVSYTPSPIFAFNLFNRFMVSIINYKYIDINQIRLHYYVTC